MLVRRFSALILFPAILAHGQKTTPDIYREANPGVVVIEGEHKSGSGFQETRILPLQVSALFHRAECRRRGQGTSR